MSLFKLGAVETVDDKPKVKATPKRVNLIKGVIRNGLYSVKVGDTIYDMTDDSMSLSRSDRVYHIHNGNRYSKPMKDSDLLREVYSIYRRGNEVAGYIVGVKFRVTHVTYFDDKTIKLKPIRE